MLKSYLMGVVSDNTVTRPKIDKILNMLLEALEHRHR